MLESILKKSWKKVLPLTLVASLLPSYARSDISQVTLLSGKKTLVEVCESNGKIQVDAENGAEAEEAGMLALVERKRVLLEKNIRDVEYGNYRMFKDAYRQSESLAKKLNKIKEIFPQIKDKFPKVSSTFLLIEGMPMRLYAVGESVKLRSEALAYLRKRNGGAKDSPLRQYQELTYFNDSTDNLKRFVEDIRDITKIDIPWTASELSSLPKKTERDLTYLNLQGVENTVKDTVSRVKKALKEERQKLEYEKHKKIYAERRNVNPLKDLRRKFSIVRGPPEEVHSRELELPLYNFQGQKIKGSVPLTLKVEKACKDKDSYSLRISLLTKDWDSSEQKDWSGISVMDPLRTNFVLFHPSRAESGDQEQSAQLVYSESFRRISVFEQTLKSKRSEIVADVSKYTLNEVLHKIAKGNVTRVKNVLTYLADKISKAEHERDQVAADAVSELLEGYLVREIEAVPTRKQATAYMVSVPVSRLDKKAFYLLVNAGIRDWYDKSRGRLEDLVIEIPNEEIEPSKGNLAYVLHESWLNPSKDMTSIDLSKGMILPYAKESRRIKSGDGKPDLILIRIVNQDYLLFDEEAMEKHNIKKDAPFSLVSVSKEKTYFAETEGKRGDKSYLKGIFMANEADLANWRADLIAKEERSRAVSPEKPELQRKRCDRVSHGLDAKIYSIGYTDPTILKGVSQVRRVNPYFIGGSYLWNYYKEYYDAFEGDKHTKLRFSKLHILDFSKGLDSVKVRFSDGGIKFYKVRPEAYFGGRTERGNEYIPHKEIGKVEFLFPEDQKHCLVPEKRQ